MRLNSDRLKLKGWVYQYKMSYQNGQVETLANYVWENLTSKNSNNETFRRFRMCSMVKKENPEMSEINRKLSK